MCVYCCVKSKSRSFGVLGIYAENSVENRTQRHGRINGLTFLRIMYVIYSMFEYVFEMSTLGFEGTETPENRVLNFPRHLSYDLLLISVSTVKTLDIKQYCILTNTTSYVILCFTLLSHRRLIRNVWQKWCSVIVRETIVLLVYGSYSGRFIGRAVSGIFRHIPAVFNKVCTTCQAYLIRVGRPFQCLAEHVVVIYFLYGECKA